MKIKRMIAMLVAVVTVASMLPVMSLSTSAADIPGDWDTFRGGDTYEETDDPTYAPAGGYTYTDEGFVMIGADYANTTPFNTVQSKEKQAIKEGMYMEFRIDEYSYSGEDGSADNWICLTVWNGQAPVPGNTNYGAGWLCLIRDNGTVGGPVSLESHNTVAYEEGVNAGAFKALGTTSTPAGVPLDDQGREIYTFEITHDGTNYTISVNGTAVAGSAELTAHLDGLDPNGEFYIGVTMMTNVKGGKAAMSILKYGTDKDSATTPVGSDSKEPEENPNQPPAPIADPSTVEVNKPCIVYDSDTVSKPAEIGQMNITPKGDGSFHIQMTETNAYIRMKTKTTESYSAQDFPVMAFLLRDCWASGGTIWYFSGDVMSANGSYHTTWSAFEGEVYGPDEEYSLVVIDLTDMWAEGRINGFRLDFNGLDADSREFDMCYAAHFRSEEEAYAYNTAYMLEKGIITDAQTGEETTAADTEPQDSEPIDTAGDGDASTEASTVAGTTDSGHVDGSGDEQEKGCASVVVGASAILMAACAVFVLRKKQ